MPPHLASEETFSRFLEAFEAGTLPRPEWTHAAHVAVAAAHLLDHSPADTLPLLRAKIQHYNLCQGIANTPDSGYHETLTRFWTAIVYACLERCDPTQARLTRVRFAVDELGSRRGLHRDYYSFDVVNSRQARAVWIPPDRVLLTAKA